VLDASAPAARSPRTLQYVSTCYVSGRYDGEFTEDMLDEGQDFNNHYESTKHAAEVLVRAAIDGRAARHDLPARHRRRGLATGETQKFDGPYLVARFLRRQPLPVAVLPSVDADLRTYAGPARLRDRRDGRALRAGPVPRAYLRPQRPRTAHQPPGRRAVRAPPRQAPGVAPVPRGDRAALARIPGLEWLTGLPAEFLDYFDTPTTYTTDHTVADLEGTGLTCPPFASYAGRLLDFMVAHPEIDAPRWSDRCRPMEASR
jgi:hypothetical protein